MGGRRHGSIKDDITVAKQNAAAAIFQRNTEKDIVRLTDVTGHPGSSIMQIYRPVSTEIPSKDLFSRLKMTQN